MTEQQTPPTWSNSITEHDKAAIIQLVCQLGLERAAYVIAALVDGTGQRGNPGQPDVPLLLEIARRHSQDWQRGIHAIAAETVREGKVRRGPQPDNLVDKLRDDFSEWWPVLHWLEENTQGVKADGRTSPPSANEKRAIQRIFGMLPRQLNLYDALLEDARKRGPDQVLLVKKLGRKRGEALLAQRLEEHQSGRSERPAYDPPRSFFDLIAPDL